MNRKLRGMPKMNGQAKSNNSGNKRRTPPTGGSSNNTSNMDSRIGNSNSNNSNSNRPSSSSSSNGPSMQITSDEVNFLIFRYLQETGK